MSKTINRLVSEQQLAPDKREWLRTLILGVVKHYSPVFLRGDYGRADIPPIPPSDALDLIEKMFIN